MKYAAKLTQAAAQVLAANPQAKEVHVTQDGQAFLPQNKQLAQLHATQKRMPKPVVIARADVSAEVAKEIGRMNEQKRSRQERAKAAREKAEKEAADKAAKEKAEKEAADKAAKEKAEKEAADKAAKDTLLGSSKQPALVKVKGGKKQLGEIVRLAYKASGMTVEQWNEQPDADREAAIEKTIAGLNA